MSDTELRYRENPKHKVGARGAGPPRWFPDSASLCPDDLDLDEARRLLKGSVIGGDPSHPNARARFALDEMGRFFKAYPERSVDGTEYWHGYPVAEALVGRQVPARVLRSFKQQGRLSRARYRRLLGSAR